MPAGWQRGAHARTWCPCAPLSTAHALMYVRVAPGFGSLLASGRCAARLWQDVDSGGHQVGFDGITWHCIVCAALLKKYNGVRTRAGPAQFSQGGGASTCGVHAECGEQSILCSLARRLARCAGARASSCANGIAHLHACRLSMTEVLGVLDFFATLEPRCVQTCTTRCQRTSACNSACRVGCMC